MSSSSGITRDFALGHAQLGYIINHGLKRYKQQIHVGCEKCFDKLLNHVSNI